MRGVGPDLGALEEVRVAFGRLLEERLEHVDRESLAEAARAREERDRGLAVEKTRDELRLVGGPVATFDGGPVAVSDGQRQPLLRGSQFFGGVFHVAFLVV